MKIAVIGGGAAGFFAAIRATELEPAASVTIYEAGKQVLSKVRISGGGRCNVTHRCFDPAALVQAYPRGGRELRSAFARFSVKDTVAWFESRGVRLKAEADGRMFPETDDSATIIDCLTAAARRAGVSVRLGAKVQSIEPSSGGFKLQCAAGSSKGSGSELRATRVMLATGGTKSSYRLAQSLGHRIVSPVPSLFTFEISDPRLEGLSGISAADAKLTLRCGSSTFKQRGPLLITHWGLSGPAVLKLSAWAARELHDHGYRAELEVRWTGANETTVREELARARTEGGRSLVKNHPPLGLAQRLWLRLLEAAGVQESTPWSEFSNKLLGAVASEIGRCRFITSGKGVFKEEFVTCGGVALNEVDFRSMESKKQPGVFFAGELLDIDAITGGYNFQAAWTTGWIAGGHLVRQER